MGGLSCSLTVAFRKLCDDNDDDDDDDIDDVGLNVLSEVRKLLCTGEVPTSFTSLFWRWLVVSSAFAGRSASCDELAIPIDGARDGS